MLQRMNIRISSLDRFKKECEERKIKEIFKDTVKQNYEDHKGLSMTQSSIFLTAWDKKEDLILSMNYPTWNEIQFLLDEKKRKHEKIEQEIDLAISKELQNFRIRIGLLEG